MIWKQFVEAVKNPCWINQVIDFLNNHNLLAQERIKSLNGFITKLDLCMAFSLLMLTSAIIYWPIMFQIDEEKCQPAPDIKPKRWHSFFVDEESKTYFHIQREKCRNNSNCDLEPFLYSIFKEDMAKTRSENSLNWLKEGCVFLAAQFGSLQSLVYVLEEGNLSPNLIDKHGITPIHLAMLDLTKGEMKGKILQLFGADTEVLQWSSPLHAAAKWSNPQKVKELLEANEDANALDASGLTPIFLAMQNENETMGLEIVEMLLKNGANCSATDKTADWDSLDEAREVRSEDFWRRIEWMYGEYQLDCLVDNFKRNVEYLNVFRLLLAKRSLRELPNFYYGTRKICDEKPSVKTTAVERNFYLTKL